MKIGPGWKGMGIVLLLMPIFHGIVQGIMNSGAIVPGQAITFMLGFMLVAMTFRISGDGPRAILGLVAGFLLWGSIGELGHLLHGGDGDHASHGAPVGAAQWGLVLFMCMGYFVTIRPYSRGGTGEAGEDGNRLGLCVAMEFFLLVWFFHVLLLTAYYHPALGVDSWFTRAAFWICAALGVYLTKLLGRIGNLASGIRVGVLVSCLLWTALEVPMKWGWLSKPWLPMRLEILAGISVLFVVWIFVPVAPPKSDR